MFNWFRRRPSLEDVGRVIGPLCAVDEQILETAIQKGWFTREEAGNVVDELPGAMHALAASLLQIDSVQKREDLFQLFRVSEESMRIFVEDSSSRALPAISKFGPAAAIAMLDARAVADRSEVNRYDKHYWLWAEFMKRVAPVTSKEFVEMRDSNSRAVSRQLLLTRLGKDAKQAILAPRKHALYPTIG